MDDALDELDETYFVDLTLPVNATIADGQGLGTITDNDDAPTISIDDVSVGEGAGTASFTVSLSAASGQDVSVNVATADDTATAGADYTAVSSTTITIPAGSTSVTVPVTILDDALDEADETYFVNLSNPVNATIADGQGLGTIVDDEGAVSISIDDASVDEGAGSATFTVSLSAASGVDVSVTVATADDTATAGADYTAVAPTVVTIPAGSTSATFSVSILEDVLDEVDETYFVNLSNPVNASISDGQGLGTIVDNDAAPTLSVNDVSVSEGGVATFTISLSAASSQNVSVTYATADDTATAGSDYTAVAPTVVAIPAGNTSVLVQVTTLDDAIDELDETYFVDLTLPVNATIADGQGLGTITDNDDAPTISIDDVSVGEGAGTASFTVSLSAASGQDVSVNVATADDTATAGADYTAVSTTTVTIPAGSTSVTVPVTILDDALDEADETYFVNLANPVNATIADGQGLGTIVDDEGAVSISIDDALVDEGAGSATFTVSLSAASGVDVSVTVATADDTATAGADYTAVAPTTITIPAGSTSATFSVSILEDALDEVDETYFVNLSNPVNASISDGQGLGTIVDNDAAPTLSVNDVSVSEGGVATFTISLSAASSQNVSVTYATADDTATAGSDYTAVAPTVVAIPAGNTSVLVQVTTLDDAIDELDETYFVNLTLPVNATIADGQGLGTITDNDDAPTISIDDVSVGEGAGTASFTGQPVRGQRPRRQRERCDGGRYGDSRCGLHRREFDDRHDSRRQHQCDGAGHDSG